MKIAEKKYFISEIMKKEVTSRRSYNMFKTASGCTVLYIYIVVNSWNGLYDYVVNSKNVLIFERKLDVWKNQEQRFNYSTKTVSTSTLSQFEK